MSLTSSKPPPDLSPMHHSSAAAACAAPPHLEPTWEWIARLASGALAGDRGVGAASMWGSLPLVVRGGAPQRLSHGWVMVFEDACWQKRSSRLSQSAWWPGGLPGGFVGSVGSARQLV